MRKLKDLFDDPLNAKCYFIADIAANHDGSLSKAKDLIHAAAESGANAAKFQNFKADSIVSDFGFKEIGKNLSHQKKWKKSVFQTYKSAELPLDWIEDLKEECRKKKIEYFTASYDLDFTRKIRDYTDIMKIGSGEITWHSHLKLIAELFPYVVLATGASNFNEVKKALSFFKKNKIVLMQCNTNYTAVDGEDPKITNERLKCINLKVLKTFNESFPKTILGLSDHTLGSLTVLVAIGLFNCKVIEKHFTLNNNDKGPDHPFSMNPQTWKDMVRKSEMIENVKNKKTDTINLIKKLSDQHDEINLCIGDGLKKVERNEKETVSIQRRGVYAKNNISKGQEINSEDIVCLRPHLKFSFSANEEIKMLNKKAKFNIKKNNPIRYKDLE